MNKILLGAVVLVAAIAVGGYFFPKFVPVGSATGSTFASAKVAEIVMSPTSASATSSSLFNSDGSDRIIDSSFVSCGTTTGSVYDQNPQTTGVSTFLWTAATTSTNNPASTANTNWAFRISLGTSTTDTSYQASSTQYTLNVNRTWPSGTYLTIYANATSSNKTLSCQAGVYYHGT